VAFAPIAIVGRSCVLPGALDPSALWELVAEGRDLVGPAPEGRWGLDRDQILREPGGPAPDVSWSDRGGYVEGFEAVWDPSGFGVGAKELERLDQLVHWVLHTAREALRDAGDDRTGAVTRSRTGAIFGNLGFPSEGMAAYASSVWTGDGNGRDGATVDPRNRFMSGGTAALLRRALGLGAGAFCLDAACASALYALKLACDRLHDGEADVMLAGAVQRADDLFLHVGFTALGALSRSGLSRPFHKEADGLVPAEGAAFVVLKRLDDARRDGDPIHGVIRGVGLSNDGRGKGLLAPSEEGQERAIRAAYEEAELGPERVSLIEAHATGTPVGDGAEIRSTGAVYAGLAGVPLGSLKSNLGHLITVAGVAGLLKVLGAMKAGMRPPTLHAGEPLDALAGSPFRLVERLEPWPSEVPRIAAVSAFGFGGNNGHLIVSEDDPEIDGRNEARAGTAKASVLAVVGLGCAVASAADRPRFAKVLFSNERLLDGRGEGRMGPVELDLEGLRFPPKDLARTLPQQLAILRAAGEAIVGNGALPRERTGIFVGMEPDPEVARWGMRWRLARAAREAGASAEWLGAARDAVVPVLEAASVVGTMPNIPANRLSSQLDLGGRAFTVQAGEASGTVALSLAMRALRSGELDAALVGAVDLSCESVHGAAVKALAGDGPASPAGDAAVLLVVKRLEDAERDGNLIYALIDEAKPEEEGREREEGSDERGTAETPLELDGETPTSLVRRFGHAHAASDLVHVAAAALSLHHRRLPGGKPWLPSGPFARVARVGVPDGPVLRLTEAAAHPRRAGDDPPRLHTFAGPDRVAVIDALRVGREGLGEAPGARLAFVATGSSLESVRARALAHLETGAPAGPGIHFRERSVSGEVAFVFAGAGAAYRGMGRDLLERLPGLAVSLSRRSRRLPRALAWSFEDDSREPTVLEQLWGASALCQLHAELTLGLLGLTPDAWMGYSSGETNALLASGTWNDIDALVTESESSGLFTRELGGRFEAVERAWGGPVRWASWTVLAPVAEVTAALAREERVHLASVHGDTDCVISGDEDGCVRVVEALGRSRCLRLGYPLAVHVPELDEVGEEWLALHRRPTTPPLPAGSELPARFYTNATAGSYVPTSESCAQAIIGQANRTLDLRPTVLAAWEDGVRVFVEHGPQAACGRWIRTILGEREALVVSLDRKGQGLEATLDAVAALVAAGVPMRAEALDELDALLRAERPSPRSGRRLAFAAHYPEIVLPPVPAPGLEPNPTGARVMAPAPSLPPVLDEDWVFRPRDPVVPDAPPAPFVPVVSVAHEAPATIFAASVSSTLSAAPALSAPVAAPVLEGFRAHVAQISRIQQDYVLAQQALHERFLSLRGSAMETFLHAARLAGTTESVTAPNSGPAASTSTPPEARVTSMSAAAPAIPATPSATPSVEAPHPKGSPVGPRFDRGQLEIHAGGRISEIFGPPFAAQDRYERQVRMPLPPLLLADRVVGLAAEPASMGKGTIWTETDVTWDSWYLHQGHMPAGVMIEAGQADLMLISYLGVDLLNRGERVYRLLGCELTYHGDLPRAGDTLRFGIHLDGHAAQDAVRLMFFHYDCTNGDRLQLTVRKGQAGFFTDGELAASAGCLWSPETQAIVQAPRLSPPAVGCGKSSFDRGDLDAFARGDAFACFGPGFERAQTHTRSPRIQDGRMLLQDRVTDLDVAGGPWGRGYLRAELDVRPDLWFFDGHFKNDPCMPGTLMFEGCLQAMAFYLAALGFTLPRDGWRFRPVSDLPYQLQCRGQVTPSSCRLVTELFVEEVVAGPVPTLFADLLCTVDGLKAFHARRVAIELVPDWPLEAMPALLAEAAADTRPTAEADGFRFDQASLLACAWGKPSKAFGPIYTRFDGPGRVARLPGPPYLFMSRVTEVDGPIGVMKPGASVIVEYDVPPDAWYFGENGCRTMPFAVLLEAVLQPCGWLSSYVGSALSVAEELGFRNLDGTGKLLGEVFPDSGTLTTRVKLSTVSATGAIIIESFEVTCSAGERPVYEMKTVFGFFPPAALANQAGLPVLDVHRELLERPSDFLVDLTVRPPEFFDPRRPRLAGPMLLMLDRVDGLWPAAGKAGLGQMRAVKDVDTDEWFFKAHFFQDPVQPGSLGIEAMIQALQLFMLQAGMDDGIVVPRFESIGTETELKWKYRGQVLPHHRTVHTTIEITAAGRDERGAWATCDASLWSDGKRIYEAGNLGMRIVPGLPDPGAGAKEIVLDPERDRWLLDHRPTWTEPALPMMSMVDLLARGSTGDGPVTGLRDLRVSGWFLVSEPRRLRCEENGETVRLLVSTPDGEKEVARARVLHGAYAPRPAPLPEARGEVVPLPYETGALFHGPAFQVVESLVMGRGESSSSLRAGSGVPVGLLNPGLLDGATHGIPHADLHTWNEACDPAKVAFPAFLPGIDFFGPTPVTGSVRCEVRQQPFFGSPDYPVFLVQLIGPDGVWSQLRLVESFFPKGPLGSADPAARRAFLRDRTPVEGLRLSRVDDGVTLLTDAEVAATDWLPGTVAAVYGSRETGEIARAEHAAAAHALHPGRLFAQLPLTRFDLGVERAGGEVRVSGDGRGTLDLSPIRTFWTRWFNRGPWPVEDLYYGLVGRFVDRVVVEDPEAYAALRGRSVLYLANHQTGVESLLFSIVASALNEVPTVTLAKVEHRDTWLGRLIVHAFSYPGVTDPRVMTFFDREDKASLVRVIGELAAEMAGPGRSVMVHVEGTRALSCRTPVEKMSGAFIDMALAVGAPVVPVRFVGGLPADSLETRLEFPLGMGRQGIHLGRPLMPERLAGLHYGARKELVLAAINGLGVPNALEQPGPGDAAFAKRVGAWQVARGVSHEHAALHEVLAELKDPGNEIRRLLTAPSATALAADDTPQGRWLTELGRRLLGG
jgi:acyl transferase domain-containing protein/3-hydroxymyristoyl/3-hydroxydecanoyl-(acyl carrier protein) dehydratase/1-acyl-sn-glycerol-3-phosphate acyltransferase